MVMSWSADHWLEKAKEARGAAAGMSDPVARRTMLEIAERYERLAIHMTLLAGQRPQPNKPEPE